MPEKELKKKENRKKDLKSSPVYHLMQKVTLYMDQYHVDGIVGLVPGGLGDAVSAIVALVHIYFGMFKLKSIPLTLALLNNVLRDVLMGMLPFFIGDIIDFLNKAHVKNMRLIDGYLNDDAAIIKDVNRKAWQSAAIFIVLILAIAGMVWFLIWLTKTLGTIIFS